MKSKLTLRLDDDLKERAKRLARERGISVSRLVEDYFRLLLREPMGREPTGEDGRPSGASNGPEASRGQTSSEEGLAGETFSPRIRALKEELGKPAPEVKLDEDTERWVEAAAAKHQ